MLNILKLFLEQCFKFFFPCFVWFSLSPSLIVIHVNYLGYLSFNTPLHADMIIYKHLYTYKHVAVNAFVL